MNLSQHYYKLTVFSSPSLEAYNHSALKKSYMFNTTQMITNVFTTVYMTETSPHQHTCYYNIQ